MIYSYPLPQARQLGAERSGLPWPAFAWPLQPRALFTDIAYEVTVCDLIASGYLCPLFSKQPKTKHDIVGVGNCGAEFIASEF